MPTGNMNIMEPNHNTPSETSPTNQTDISDESNLTEAVQALQQLTTKQLEVLEKVVSSLTQTDSSSGEFSTSSVGEIEPSSIGAESIGDNAIQGMEAATYVQNLGFTEFTAGLINGTFDAIIGATVKQMEAYAKLVADLSKSIQQFEAENVSDAQIDLYLAEGYPDGEGGTSVRPGYTFSDIPPDLETGALEKSGGEQLQDVVRALINETKGLVKQELNLTLAKLNIPDSATSFNQDQVTQIRESISALLATSMIEQLRQMAQDGMARIVVTDGEIMTKLTFNITTSELQEKQKANYNKNINRTNIKGRAGGGWWGLKASTDNTNINVNSMNETSFDSTTMSTEMIGQVKIRFKTESFPPYVPPTSSEEQAQQPSS